MFLVSAAKCFRNTFQRHTAPALATTTTIRCYQQRRPSSNGGKHHALWEHFASSEDNHSTLKTPDFNKYSSKGNPRSNQTFSYFIADSLGLPYVCS